MVLKVRDKLSLVITPICNIVVVGVYVTYE
jgi:hypothetical protein